MGLRERVQQAVEGPVRESERLLLDVQEADAETRLSILINGWCRGVSAALEELAIAIDDLRERRSGPAADATPGGEPAEPTPPEAAAASGPEGVDLTDLDEERLADEARKSSEETAALRREAEQIRRDLEQ
jgi:hypothetical protein